MPNAKARRQGSERGQCSAISTAPRVQQFQDSLGHLVTCVGESDACLRPARPSSECRARITRTAAVNSSTFSTTSKRSACRQHSGNAVATIGRPEPIASMILVGLHTRLNGWSTRYGIKQTSKPDNIARSPPAGASPARGRSAAKGTASTPPTRARTPLPALGPRPRSTLAENPGSAWSKAPNPPGPRASRHSQIGAGSWARSSGACAGRSSGSCARNGVGVPWGT